jgi:hypothetical protein
MMSDDELKRSRRAIYANAGSLYLIIGGMLVGAYLLFPDSTSLRAVGGGLYGFILYIGTKYVTRSIQEIDEYTKMRNEYLKTLHPDWERKIRRGR